MWFGRMSTFMRTGLKTFTISKLGLHKRVFTLILKYLKFSKIPLNIRSTPAFVLFFSPFMYFTQYEPHTIT